MLVEYAKMGASVCGIEELHPYCRQSQFALNALGLKGEIINSDVLGSALDGRRFDVVLCLGVLYHTRYPMLLLDKLRSLTVGYAVIETDTSTLPGKAIEFFPDKPAGKPTPEALKQMIEFAGFRITSDDVWLGDRHILFLK